MKFTLRKIPRGQGGEFFISTFRFPLKVAQNVERIALANGLSMSSVINQVMEQFVESVDVPKDIRPVKTAHATVWGEKANEPIKLKMRKASRNEVEDDEEKPAKRARNVVKVKAKKVAKAEKPERKAKKVAKAAKAEKPVKKKAALNVLKKLKKRSAGESLPD